MMRIGPLGGLREIVSFPEVPVAPDRPGSEWRTMSGRRIVQRAPRALRSWSLDFERVPPADVAYLSALASGALPGPLYLYTEVAAQTNLLPADVAAPGAMGVSGLLLPDLITPPRGRVQVLMGGALVSLTGVSCDPALPGVWTATLPLPLGSYRLSGWATSAGSVLTWRTVDASGSQVATGTVTASSSSGSFRGESTVTLSGAAVGLQVRLPADADPFRRVGAFRLTAGSTAQGLDWVGGEGVPEVVVDDPSQTLQLVTAGRVAADYSVTIREVR